jgi:hypothetical protein
MPKTQNIIPGKNYRLTRTYRTGAVATFEGRVDEVMSDVVCHWLRTEASGEIITFGHQDAEDGSSKVKIERLRDTYPTRPGTLVAASSGHTFVRIGSQWHETQYGAPVDWPPHDCKVIA